MTLHSDTTRDLTEYDSLAAPGTTGRYCSICDEPWHEPYAHQTGAFWHIPASDGAYRLVYHGKCACPGFVFRGNCKHAALATGLERQGKKHDLPDVTWLRYEQERWPMDYAEDPTIDDLRGFLG